MFVIERYATMTNKRTTPIVTMFGLFQPGVYSSFLLFHFVEGYVVKWIDEEYPLMTKRKKE